MSQPWFTAGLKVSRQNKDKLAKKARIKKGIHKEKYLIYRRLYHKLIKIAKHQYYKKLFIQYKNDPKMLWSTANEVVGRDKGGDDFINIPGVESDRDMAEKFNLYFSNIAVSLANKISLCTSNLEGCKMCTHL